MHKSPVTRFAPSPTGYLHIGGARTALFNWLYARANDGTYLVRIEDTDRQRSTDVAYQAIMDGLDWLKLTGDRGYISQNANLERHKEIAEQLLQEGKAYKCFCSKEELDAMRERARAEGKPMHYDGTWRDKDPSEAPEDVSPVIRFKSPEEDVLIKDSVQGDVRISGQELDDLIILRSDGTPTYMLSVVVDDHDMQVTHIIRGDDHLTNAARQIQLYQALEWELPQFSHIPLIHGADGAKLSKRHGALGVGEYHKMGFLREAMLNYLLRLGWSHGDDEIISLEQMISWFNLENIGKSPARFDMAKLESLNKHYIKEMSDDALTKEAYDFLAYREDGGDIREKLTPAIMDQWTKLMPALKERSKTLIDIIEGASFLWAELPLQIEEKLQKHLDDTALENMNLLSKELEALEIWNLETIENLVRSFAEKRELKFGQLAPPLRAKLTGTTNSPAIFDVLYAIGKKEALKRIKNAEMT